MEIYTSYTCNPGAKNLKSSGSPIPNQLVDCDLMKFKVFQQLRYDE